MKKKIYITGAALSLCILLIILITTNSKPQINASNPAFIKYISAYTSGKISRKGTIRIELAQSVNDSLSIGITSNADSASIKLPDSSLLDDVFDFEPTIKGHAIWISDRIIEFIPDQELLQNQSYTASFDLEELMEVNDELETFCFKFSVYPQRLTVGIDGLRCYDNYNIEWLTLLGVVKTTDFVDTAVIKKTIKVLQNGKEIPFCFYTNYDNKEFYFRVDSIERTNKAGIVSVSWDGEPISCNSKGEQQIKIKSLGDFSISNYKVIDDEEDQSIELNFSDPLLFNQDLNGIITIQGVDNLTYAINDNVVKIFLPNRIQGNKVIKVTNGIKNFKGYKMDSAYSQELFFKKPSPLVRIKGSGTILPNSNGLLFPFEAISLKAVDVRIVKIYVKNVHQFLQVNDFDGQRQLRRVGKKLIEKKVDLTQDNSLNLKQWNTFVLDLEKFILPEPGAIYQVSIKFRKKYALCDCPEDDDNNNEYYNVGESEDDDNWSEYNWDHEDDYSSWYYYNNDASPCDEGYYYGKGVKKNIFASNLGLIYKLDEDKTSHAFVTNMITTKPIKGVLIQYYDYTKQVIASGFTNNEGMLDVKLSRKPFLMVAKLGKQRGYLKLRNGYINSLSKFDIEGESVQKDIKGFIYGERGVWRPGDSLYLNFILEDKNKRLPKNHPVSFELQNPEGAVIYQTIKSKNVNGTYDFRTATNPEAVTGNYLAKVSVGNISFKKSLKIETVKPNRLKVYLDFNDKIKNDTVAKLSAKWLHGAIAGNLKAKVTAATFHIKTTFKKYKTYEFDSPIRWCNYNSETIFDGYLNKNGEATINTKLNTGESAVGTLKTNYRVKVFEKGGDFSSNRFSSTYLPYKTYIGLKAPTTKSYDNNLEVNKQYKFELISINTKEKLVNTSKLKVRIYKIASNYWYENDEEYLAKYISKAGTIIVKDTLIKLEKGKGSFRFGINYPQYGKYLITVTDLKGGHQTGKAIYFDWPYWSRANRIGNKNANMLSFASDKENYVIGEYIKLSIPSPTNGRALISVENETRVVKKFWIKIKKGETTYKFPATADMSPNVYLHVTLLLPHINTKKHLPIRMYGVIGINVDNPNTHLHPEIIMQDEIKPESTTTIRIKEKNGRKMTYTLALVDDGLLDLTRFSTPEPWTTFYARRTLGVKTWDMYDFVLGAYAGKFNKLLSIGGDGNALNGRTLKANRFKPMVRFVGPFTLYPDQNKYHKIKIPNYIGSLRVMVVAQNKGTYGKADKTVKVKKPLMVLATLPRVLGPGETVSLPVNIFALEEQIKDVTINVQVNDLFLIKESKQQNLHFNKTGDKVANFKLQTKQKTGVAKLKITATCGKEKSYQEIEIDIRTPNPKVVAGLDRVLEPGKEWSSTINFKGITGTNKATIEVSNIPALGLEKRLDYLIQYPHGCVEQTTSSVFPQLFIDKLVDLTSKQKSRITKNIKAALKRLQSFQTVKGGFSYWPNNGSANEWGTNYAGHFIIEAEKIGYRLPLDMKRKWIDYQQNKARKWSNAAPSYIGFHGNETNESTQAYRLFTLALCNHPELGAMNRLHEEKHLSASAKWRLAAAYKIVGQKEIALKLIKGLPTTVAPYNELSYSFGSDVRDKAMILESLSLLQQKTKAWPVAKEIAAVLNSPEWMSTQETAYCLLAICKYVGTRNKNAIKFTYSLNGAKVIAKSSSNSICQLKYSDKDLAKQTKLMIKNTGQNTLFAKVIVEGTPLIGDKTTSFNSLKLKVSYSDMEGNIIQPDTITQGMDFMAKVTITNPSSKRNIQQIALSQIFPSGWEIHNARLDGTGYNNNTPNHQDIRDDRVYTYFSLNKGESKSFKMQLNATYLGRFYLPTQYVEAMYNHTINARIPGKWVEVVKPKIMVIK